MTIEYKNPGQPYVQATLDVDARTLTVYEGKYDLDTEIPLDDIQRIDYEEERNHDQALHAVLGGIFGGAKGVAAGAAMSSDKITDYNIVIKRVGMPDETFPLLGEEVDADGPEHAAMQDFYEALSDAFLAAL